MVRWLMVVLLAAAQDAPENRGAAKAESARPERFPHRIWAAADFEAKPPGDAWFGPTDAKNIPSYPGNGAALAVGEKPYKKISALMTGFNPVPGPCMGKVNSMYCRYFLKGATEALFQHFSLTSGDNNHVRVSGLTEGAWSELTINFSRHGKRNNGAPGVPFKDGERMDDLKVFVGKPNDGREYELLLDDVIFFADDPALPPEPEPFPNRVMFVAAFDTGLAAKVRDKFYPGQLEFAGSRSGAPEGSYWGVAKAVAASGGKKHVQLKLDPPRPAGAKTKVRFRYHLTGASVMTVRVTAGEVSSVRLSDLKPGAWTFQYVDLPVPVGQPLADLTFEVDGNPEFFLDEVVLFDAGSEKR
jgi:hypothetical protein